MMLLALLLLVCYGCLAESQPPNPSIPIRVPPTLLDSSSSICPAQPSSDIIIEEELRKTKNIINRLLRQPSKPSIPIRVPPTILDSDSSCPVQLSSDIIEEELRKTRNIINSAYMYIALRPCQCGGSGWTRVLYLNMADNGTSCPAEWKLFKKPVRGCGRKKASTLGSCESVLIPVTMNYSIVCGRIHAYQRGDSEAFYYSVYYYGIYGLVVGIDSSYVSGLSLTHGLVGQRKHVWTFAGANDETTRDRNNNTLLSPSSCPCTNPALTWPYEVPSYVGNSYFCDTGAHTTPYSRKKVYMDDPLWDGEGCGGSSTCCSFNNPPWFCQHLNYHTSDNLELRLCSSSDIVSLVEIYVK